MSRFSSSNLLPSETSEFHTETYWEKFFKQRGNKAFEWYGEFQDFISLIKRYTPNTDETFLVIGCGNSEFSSNLYDEKYRNITNIDFSEYVVNEMKQKNNTRQLMKWLVADMTNMNVIPDNSYQNIFDKGALDALLSTPDLIESAMKLFNEINRILVVNGKYFCITLAQDFIITALFKYFVETVSLYYEFVIDVITNQKTSSLIPFMVCVTKINNKSKNVGLVGVRFNSFGKSLTTTNFLTTSEALKLVRIQ